MDFIGSRKSEATLMTAEGGQAATSGDAAVVWPASAGADPRREPALFRSALRSSLYVSLVVGIGYLVSFISQFVIARSFGASTELDAYLTGYAIPGSAVGFMANCVGYVGLPMLARHGPEEGPDNVMGRLFLVTGFLALAVMVVGGGMAHVLVRVGAPKLSPEKLALAIRIQRLFWVVAGLQVISACLTAFHHFTRSFLLPSISVLVLPAGVIIGCLTLASRIGVMGLAWGFLGGAALQVVLLLPIASALKFSLKGVASTGVVFLSAAIPNALSLLPFGFLPVIDAFWASGLTDGALSYLGYASRIVIAISAICAQGICVVLFPSLVEHAAGGNLDSLRTRLQTALKIVIGLTIPLACLVAVLRVPLVALALQRGRFDEQATKAVAAVLPWYLVGMIALSCMFILSRGLYSVSKFLGPGLIAVGSLTIYAAASGVLSFKFGYWGIGAAYAVEWWLLVWASSLLMSRRVGPLWAKEQVTFVLKLLVVSLGIALLVREFYFHILSALPAVPRLALVGTAGTFLSLFLAFLLFNAAEKQRLLNLIHREGQ